MRSARGPANEINEAADEAIKRFRSSMRRDRSRAARATAVTSPTGSRSPPLATAPWSVTPANGTSRHNGRPATTTTTASETLAVRRGRGFTVADAESDAARGESQDAGARQRRRARLPSPDEQRARVLDRAPAAAGAEQADRLADGESLDPERREQPVLLP